jgi:hypothetical protein
MDISVPSRPLSDELFAYAGTDTNGGRSYRKPEDSFPRLLANLLAVANTAGAIHRDRDRCNARLQAHGRADGPSRIVNSAASSIAAVNVPGLSEFFAVAWTGHYLSALLAAPSEQAVRKLSAKGMELLGLTSMKEQVLTAFRKAKEKLISKDLAMMVGTTLLEAGEEELREAHALFEERAEEQLDAVADQIHRFFATQAVPAAVRKMVSELATSAKSLEEMLVAMKEIGKQVHAAWLDEEKNAREASSVAHADGQAAEEGLEGEARRGFFGRNRRAGETVAKVLAHQQGVIQAAFSKTYADILALVEKAVKERTERLSKIGDAVRVRVAAVREEGRSQQRSLAADTTSVLTAEERKLLPGKLLSSIKADTGQEINALSPKQLLEAGVAGLDNLIEEYAEGLRLAVEQWFKAEVPSLLTFATRMELAFKLTPWVEEALAGLARACPLELSAVGQVQEKILLVAAGEDLDAIQKALSRNKEVHGVEVVAGANPLSVSVTKTISGMPLSALPVQKEAERAAKKYPRPGKGTHVYDVLASSFLLVEPDGASGATNSVPGIGPHGFSSNTEARQIKE